MLTNLPLNFNSDCPGSDISNPLVDVNVYILLFLYYKQLIAVPFLSK